MKKLLVMFLLVCSALTAGIPTNQQYHGPTEQLIKKDSWHKIEKKIKKMGISKDLIPFFNSIASDEDYGHIGYHGSNQGYRFYQDIIRLTLEEILGFSIRKDFHFLRVPGDSQLNLNSLQEFTHYWGKKKIDNKNKTRAKQLLSLNYGIYSNYDNKGSCSINLFIKDKSKTKMDYVSQLSPFYKELGISEKALKKLFAIGRKWLDEDGGILLQLSENSHITDPNKEAYNFADNHCYPAKKGGYLYGSYPISNHYERVMTDYYVKQKLKISPQLRIIINNRHTLNPYSHLIVKRWDLYDPYTIDQYEAEMRNYIKNLNYDAVKVEKYKKKLIELWSDEL